MKQELRDKKPHGIGQLCHSFKHALDGIIYAFTVEQNMFIHVVVMLLVIGMGIFFELNTVEWLFCLIMFGLVLATELMNTALEAVVDLATEQYHILAKVAKDTAAGAVLVLALTSIVGGFIIFLPKAIIFFMGLI